MTVISVTDEPLGFSSRSLRRYQAQGIAFGVGISMPVMCGLIR